MKIATLCFPVRDGKIFLAKKKQGLGAGFVNGYGGKMHPEDPSIEDSAIREIQEESGVIVSKESLKKVGIVDFYREGEYTFECHVYLFEGWEGNFIETEEMAAPVAYEIASPPFEQMFPADRKWLPLICRGEKIRAKCYFDKDFKKELGFEYEPLTQI
jgi:8-oxo-dGTP pyrophosphatase MutT (NUDIX family)